jgi:predicted nucleic acid-binding protein
MSSARRGSSEAQRLTAPYVYDAGALIALDNNDRRMWARHKLALDEARDIHVPAVVVGQAWRDARRQVRLGQVLAGVQVGPVGPETSKAAGVLCGKARTPDVVDAIVVVTAAAQRAIIWTADVSDIRLLCSALAARPEPRVRAV